MFGFRAAPPLTIQEEKPSYWQQPMIETLPNLSVFEFTLFVLFMSFLIGVRTYGNSHPMKKQAVLHMGA